ncbi:aspartyl/asparaginyl beta-hydroxylase domain-containing protein [Sphingomonas hengshuiensis]|uniref:aspartyl/asparaginyl beta-hydroxylase domain-containing protein n=1 Tax=Sphingomonas hengshuiensis TaxID=1609977 RepID=UPI000982246A|nr:aspartyl/asparaginyl beta-hydroxylase domain-containing protein [Sphingomonas hengshuiensis]
MTVTLDSRKGAAFRHFDSAVTAPDPAGAFTPAALAPGRDRPWFLRHGTPLRGALDRIVAASSLVSNAPVLDMRDFGWTQLLRDHWPAIRDEAVAAAREPRRAPSLARVPPDPRAIGIWRAFFLWGHGYRIAENLDRCPVTAGVVARIPGLNSAFFSVLAPGTHLPPHRGVTKGLITCHLGLVVPRDGDVRMRVGDRVVRWAEGETLVFDDTYDHELWNDSTGTRVVLLLQFRRPLRQPGRWLADTLLGMLPRWNAALTALERQAPAQSAKVRS